VDSLDSAGAEVALLLVNIGILFCHESVVSNVNISPVRWPISTFDYQGILEPGD
jgi:hypothetical protein